MAYIFENSFEVIAAELGEILLKLRQLFAMFLAALGSGNDRDLDGMFLFPRTSEDDLRSEAGT
jgi:hypothetical protein